MTLQEAMNDYMLFINHEQGLAKTSRETYKSWLRHFHRWLIDNGDPEPSLDAFNTDTLRKFLHNLGDRNLRPRTVRAVFHPLRALGVYLIAQGVLEENPVNKLKMPRLDAAFREEVTDDEISRLMAACNLLLKPEKVAFSRAIMAGLVYAGLRRIELVNLRVSDVSLDTGRVLIRAGKGSKRRCVFICQDGIDAMREWLEHRPDECRHDYFYALDTNRRVHYDGLSVVLDTLQAAAGMRDRTPIRPHSMRHACATRLLRAGANLRDIQAFLGHACLQTTAVYLHSGEEQVRALAGLTALPENQSVKPAVKAEAAIAQPGKPQQQPVAKPSSKPAVEARLLAAEARSVAAPEPSRQSDQSLVPLAWADASRTRRASTSSTVRRRIAL